MSNHENRLVAEGSRTSLWDTAPFPTPWSTAGSYRVIGTTAAPGRQQRRALQLIVSHLLRHVHRRVPLLLRLAVL